MNFRAILILFSTLLLVACATQPRQTPVIERAPGASRPPPPVTTNKPVVKTITAGEKDWRPDSYIVKKGDTLYALGLEFGLDYKDIARWNDISPPYVIKIGQALRLKETTKAGEQPTVLPTLASDGAVVTPIKLEPAPQAKTIGESSSQSETKTSGDIPLKTEPKAIKEPWSEQANTASKSVETKTEPGKAIEKSVENTAEKASPLADEDAVDWSWPTRGKIISGFSGSGGNGKGIDIAGEQNQAIMAAAPGKVVYSGSGLSGYGKLLIIKHNKTYLSVYANNSQILVKEGQEVAKGQKVAEMGNTDTDRVKLHFEIRKLGKPVDPIAYLPTGNL